MRVPVQCWGRGVGSPLTPLPRNGSPGRGRGRRTATAHAGGLSLYPNFLRLNQISFLMDCYLNYLINNSTSSRHQEHD